tara:strand:+ start:448 stop:696 length:249 start_codon:yes stop_codon:yes gene_type:complete
MPLVRNAPTPEQKINNLLYRIRTTNPMLFGLLRERIVMIMELTIKDIESNPETWDKGIISASLYKDLADIVQKSIGYEFDTN